MSPPSQCAPAKRFVTSPWPVTNSTGSRISTSLTGLFNRRGFDKAAAGALASRTAPGRPAAALMCDLDLFKGINDRLGHEFGDAALRHVANVLREAAGSDHMVLGRIGGEEFGRCC